MREKKSRKNIIRRMVSGFSAFAIALALCFVAIPETVHASDYELTSVCITGDGRILRGMDANHDASNIAEGELRTKTSNFDVRKYLSYSSNTITITQAAFEDFQILKANQTLVLNGRVFITKTTGVNGVRTIMQMTKGARVQIEFLLNSQQNSMSEENWYRTEFENQYDLRNGTLNFDENKYLIITATADAPEPTQSIEPEENQNNQNDQNNQNNQDNQNNQNNQNTPTDPTPAAQGTTFNGASSGTQGMFKVTSSDTGKAEVSYVKAQNSKAKKVKIPSVVKDDKGVEYKVTKVEGKAFYKNKKVRSVTVPSTVTSIGGGAFKYCSNLNNIKLNGNTLKSIGKGAFSNIKEGATITIVAKNKKTFDKIVKKIKKSGAKNVKYKFQKG